MIRLKPLLEIQLIKEALPFSLAKAYTSIQRNPDIDARMDSILDFLKQQPDAKVSRNGQRVAIPFKGEVPAFEGTPSVALARFYKSLDKHRQTANAMIHSYLSGGNSDVKVFGEYPSIFYLASPTVKDQYGRDVKMSKYLNSMASVLIKGIDAYANKNSEPDPETGVPSLRGPGGKYTAASESTESARAFTKKEFARLAQEYNEIPEVEQLRANKPKPYYIVFSKHQYDVAGQSTERGWTSCMNLYTGSNKRYVQKDVKEGTIVAYLVREDDLNIKSPTARVSIKPFVNLENKSDVLYEPEQSIYGTAPPDFKKQVNDLITQAQPGKTGTFQLVDTLYCDSKSHITKNDQQLVDHCRDLVAAGKQATTVDEAKYIIQKFCLPYGYKWNPENVQFEDAKGLYAIANHYIQIDPNITYSPVQFKYAWSFDITGVSQENLKTMPGDVNDLHMRLPNIRNFEGMKTKVSEALFLTGFRGDNFNGLRAGPKVIDLGMHDGHASVIKSFAGIPATVNQIKVNRNNIVDMTIEQLIEELKPIQPRMFQFPVNDIEAGNNKLTKSMKDWMNRIPVATNVRGEIYGSQYKRMLWQISQQLPTLDYLFMSSLDSIRHTDDDTSWIQTLD